MADSIQDIISAARKALNQLRAAIPAGQEHLTTIREARQTSDYLGIVTDLAEKLHAGDSADTKRALARMQELYPKTFPEGSLPSLEAVQSFVKKEVIGLTEDLKEFHGRHENSWRGLTRRAVSPEIEAEQKGTRFLERMMTKQNKWLEGKSGTTRATIANAEILFGSVLALQGAYWIIRSLKSEQLSQKVTDNGVQFQLEPVPYARRAGSAVSGMATLMAGLGVMALGGSAHGH